MATTQLWMSLVGVALFLTTSAQARINPRVEDGLAITHPRVVETLSQRTTGEGIGLAYYLDPTGKSPTNLSNKFLAKLPAFRPILQSVKNEIAEYTRTHQNAKGTRVGVGVAFEDRLFDTRFLEDDRARFVLTGVINRPDNAFKDPATCGEVRFIYRLAYTVQINGDKSKTVMSRLPMTINLVMNAKAPNSTLTCQELARRWKNLNIEGLSVTDAANTIMAANGVLAPELRDRSLIKQLEINLQLAREPAAVRPDFGGNATYLLKVYKFDARKGSFQEAALDNQVDKAKAKEFYNWLFDPASHGERIKALDQGTIIIPEQFLMKRAISIAPGALSRAINHPLYNTLSDANIAKQLNTVASAELINIKSVEGFKRRLTDVSCTGCHQTRAIGGFHFMGQDPYHWSEDKSVMAPLYPGNSVVVPASGHFFADLRRRRVIFDAVANGQQADYTTGFSSRPQEHVASRVSEGLGIYNGWGSHCYNGNDPSFSRWTCAAPNRCVELHHSEIAKGMGVCVSQTGQQLGDPTETGNVAITHGTEDKYTRLQRFPMPTGNQYVNSPQSASPGEKTGGFPGGSIRLNSCDAPVMAPHKEARCGALPAASSGFNDCLFQPNVSFKQCLDKYSKGVGLRGCSRENPCRDDYICVESLVIGLEDVGVCVPPYFLFQFRVDGHPVKF